MDIIHQIEKVDHQEGIKDKKKAILNSDKKDSNARSQYFVRVIQNLSKIRLLILIES